jgi:hypothetical protein
MIRSVRRRLDLIASRETATMKITGLDVSSLSFAPADMGAGTDDDRRALAARCVRVAEQVCEALGLDVDCDAAANDGADALDLGNEVFDAVCGAEEGDAGDEAAAARVLRRYTHASEGVSR